MPILYTPTIPQATDQIALSQNQILNNFGAINEFVNKNHGSFNTVNVGKHALVNMINVTPVAPIGTDINLFNAISDGLQQLFVQTNNFTGTAYPITQGNNSASTGYFYLPSGYIVQWGYYPVTTSASYAITFPFPNEGLFGIAVPRATLDPTFSVSFSTFPAGPTVSTFSALSNQTGGFSFWYLLIGY